MNTIIEVTKKLLIMATNANHPVIAQINREAGKYDDLKLACKFIKRMQYATMTGSTWMLTPTRIFKEYLAECGFEVAYSLSKRFYPNGYKNLIHICKGELSDEGRSIFDPNCIEKKMALNATQSSSNTDHNPFGGGLWKSNVIFAIAGTNNPSKNIILSDGLYLKTGLRGIAMGNFEETKKTKGNEYVVQIRLYLKGFDSMAEEGVLRVLWDKNKGSYVGFVYQKYERECRKQWDAWKRNYREVHNL